MKARAPGTREREAALPAKKDGWLAGVGDAGMLAMPEQLEVGQGVVELIAVDVVDVLGSQERAFDGIRHDQAVEPARAPENVNADVAIGSEGARAFRPRAGAARAWRLRLILRRRFF